MPATTDRLIEKLTPASYFLVAALVATSQLCAQDDIVLRVSGGQVRGKIEASSRTGVTIDGQNVPVTDIRYVMFGGEPPVMRQIRDAAAKGGFAQAERYLERLDDAKLSGALMKTDAEFYRAYVRAQRALQTGKYRSAAARQMVEFAKANAKSFHFYDAAETLGALAWSLNKTDEAARYYGALEKAPLPGLKLRGLARMAESYLARGNYDEALKRYEAMLQSTQDNDARTEASLGIALCQAELGQSGDGITTVEQIIADADPKNTSLLARAYNALGACYRASNQANAAVISYLHVDLLYAKHSDQHAEALYHLSRLWGQVGHQDRAKEARDLLQSKYAGTAWASK